MRLYENCLFVFWIGGIRNLCPDETRIHDELFVPVGYSMNGVLPDSDEYITVTIHLISFLNINRSNLSIHITPEPNFSYVSFETNQRRVCLYEQALKVLRCFR